MKTAILLFVFLLLWAVVGLFALTLWHDWRARRGHRVTVTGLQVFLGGPVLWLFELCDWLRSRRKS